jgi:dihydrofolate synthase/folylpolyglutamate synthase
VKLGSSESVAAGLILVNERSMEAARRKGKALLEAADRSRLFPFFRSLPCLLNKLQSALMSASYQEALEYLYGFVNFEHRTLDRYSPENISLERVQVFLELLGNPQDRYPSIHIAGTKGKGSVAAMCAFTLRASGLKCALYTSPHLRDFRDRIRIITPDDSDGRIREEQVGEFVDRIKPAVSKIVDLTWYELVTAIAFLHFAEEGVDIAVIEVGLGGRLDASNVITPLVSVITSLSLDHTYLLGHTMREIATEKGGIIKNGIPVISAPQDAEALSQLEQIAAENRVPITVIGREWRYEPEDQSPGMDKSSESWTQQIVITEAPDSALVPAGSSISIALAGRHQQENAVVALAALDIVRETFPELTLEKVKEGLANVKWPGRMQVLAHGGGSPTLLADCAHNVDSAQKLAYTLENDFEYEKLVFIIGTTADKDVKGIMNTLLPISNLVFLTTSGHPRASDPDDMVRIASELGYESQALSNLEEAIRAARRETNAGDLICVTGSIFMVGDLLNHWGSLQSQLWV